MDMQTKLNKWGNSWAIRIPSTFLQELKIDPGKFLEISVEKDQIVIKKKADNLEAYLKNFTKSTTVEKAWPDVIPVGKEIWWK